jgi:hypothetical protein
MGSDWIKRDQSTDFSDTSRCGGGSKSRWISPSGRIENGGKEERRRFMRGMQNRIGYVEEVEQGIQKGRVYRMVQATWDDPYWMLILWWETGEWTVTSYLCGDPSDFDWMVQALVPLFRYPWTAQPFSFQSIEETLEAERQQFPDHPVDLSPLTALELEQKRQEVPVVIPTVVPTPGDTMETAVKRSFLQMRLKT